MPDEKKPAVAFWTTAMVLALLVGYLLSFGPACWCTSRLNAGASAMSVIYRPLTWVMLPDSSHLPTRFIIGYAKIGAPEDWQWGAVIDVKGQCIGWLWRSTLSVPPF